MFEEKNFDEFKKTEVWTERDELIDWNSDFTDTLVDAPISSGKFKLEYTYHIGGQLRSYKDPYGKEIVNAFDQSGRILAVTGTSFGSVPLISIPRSTGRSGL